MRRRGILDASGHLGAPQTPGGIVVPSGFLTPTAYTSLAKDWVFTGGTLPTNWNAVTNTSDFLTSPTTADGRQVTMTGTAARLGLDTAAHAGYGSETYVAGLIATTTAPGAVANYYLPNFFHFKARMQMPSFSGGANASGVWPGIALYSAWAATSKMELDVVEQNMSQPFAVNCTIHDNAPSTAWSQGLIFTMSANPSAGFHWFETIKEPGMISWLVDNTVVAQYTKTQAVAAGHGWDLDTAQDVYPAINNSLTTTGIFGASWSASNNGQLTAGNVFVLVSEVQVYQ